MYLHFYGLKKPPFHMTPDPEFLFLSPTHKEALGSVIYGIQEKKGFIAVTGEVGLGKTTVLRTYLLQADNLQDQIIYLLNPSLSFTDLLQQILSELGHEPIGRDEPKLVSQLHEILIEQYRKGNPVILVIDEAQNMPLETLEKLRMLSNLETSTDKLIQIVLAGQPELNSLLERHELRQLNQRIAVRATIAALTKSESLAYIKHRLAKAGLKGKTLFNRRALSLLIREAHGNPRRLNVLCDNALVTGLGYKKKPVTAGIAKEVIADLNGSTRHSWKWAHAAGSFLLIVVLAGLLLWERQDMWGSRPLTTLQEFVHQSSETIKKYLFGEERKADGKEYSVLLATHVLDVPPPPKPPQLPPVPQPPPQPSAFEVLQRIKL